MTLRTLGRRLWRAAMDHRRLVLGALICAALQAFFTKAPYLLIDPLADSLTGQGSPTGDGFADRARRAFDDLAVGMVEGAGIEFGEKHEQKSIIAACAIFAAMAGLIGGIFIYLTTLLSRFFAARATVDLRNEIAGHLLGLPLRYFGKQRMGELISRLTNNTQVLSRAYEMVADRGIAEPFMILGNIGIVAFAAPELLLVFLPMIPLMALPMIRLGKKVHRRSGKSLRAMGDATESMNQMLSGIKTVKAFQLENAQHDQYSRSNEVFLERTRRMLQAKGRSQGIVFMGYQAGFGVMIMLLGWVMLSGERDLGDVALILVPISTTYTNVKRMARTWNTAMESLGALESIEEILAEQPDPVALDGQRLEQVDGRVELQGVSFAYGDEAVLHDVTFAVEPGTTVALVGPSGAGKSTLIDLLARFYDPSKGSVQVDGHDLRKVELTSYRRHVAMVVQQPFLFNTTVADNIRYGKPGASMAEIEAAARVARVDEFVGSLPDGYDTVVGERGSNLSGGQMQRITIARAVLRDPAVLFLDEATSALDSESEKFVQSALDELMQNRTSFVIAHRLATVRDADLILVMERGRIVERGRHDELVQQDGLYRRLIDLQALE